MMHIFLNGLGASAGGGLTYLRNVLPHLSKMPGVKATVAISHEVQLGWEGPGNAQIVRVPFSGGAARRFWFEQTELPKLIRKSGADVLVSAGNFALRHSPAPQILLSRNSLYTSQDFYRDLIDRGEDRMWLETRIRSLLARRSMQWADRTVAPSEAFAAELQRWSGRPVTTIHHGFDQDIFLANRAPLPDELRRKLECPPGTLRLLLVSHYNYYRNFETVFRAMARFSEQGTRNVRLFLTCELKRGKNPGAYDPERAARLVEELGIRKQVVELGAVPYELLHHVYRACDLFVTAAYTETFAHPLVEAMASGAPVIASDLPVHREICGDSAQYFHCFSADELAARIALLSGSETLRASMSVSGGKRARLYSWEKHVSHLQALARELAGDRRACAATAA